MNCPKCGASLDADAKFCTSCGAVIEAVVEETAPVSSEVNSVPETAPAKPAEGFTKFLKWVGPIVGTVLIIIGLTRIFGAGISISRTSFGADFYTYAYKGIVEISEILASIEVTLGWIIVAIGAAIDISSLKGLLKKAK